MSILYAFQNLTLCIDKYLKFLPSNLDLEGSLEATGKESTKWTYDTAEQGQCNRVKHKWIHSDCFLPSKLQKTLV